MWNRTPPTGTRRYTLVTLLFLFTFLNAGQSSEPDLPPQVLRVAILPDQSAAHIRERYAPLLTHLREHAGLESELRIPLSYEELLRWFYDGEVDLVLFGGITYVRAHLRSGAVPLVIRDIDGRSRSIVLVRGDNPASSLEDLEGVALAFGDRLSTTGHVMPRYYFRLQGIEPEKYFSSIHYSGAHDLTAEWVRDGRITAGVSNSAVVSEMFRDGRLRLGQVRIIWESPPLADYVWAVQPGLSDETRRRIRDSFLHMNYRPEDTELLQALGANYYLPVMPVDFAVLEDYVRQQKARSRP